MSDSLFIDSHCHFDFSDFAADREQIWQRCRDRGVSRVVVPGVDPGQWQGLPEFCQHIDGCYFMFGLHPWWIERQPNWRQALADLQRSVDKYHAHKDFAGVGECGLDATIDVPMATQIDVLNQHLTLAKDYSRPVTLHCVKSHNDLLRSLKQRGIEQGVVHGFSGSAELAMAYCRLGMCIGIGGTITYPRARKTRAAVAAIPDTALLLETDSPDMPLTGLQGQRNSPENVVEVARVLAQLRGVTVEEIARITTGNAERVFGF